MFEIFLYHSICCYSEPCFSHQSSKAKYVCIYFSTVFIRNQFCIFFSGKSSSRNSSRSGFRRYIIFVTSTVSVIVALTFTLGETNAVHVGYGKIIII